MIAAILRPHEHRVRVVTQDLPEFPIEPVTKLDAVRRQLRLAITLFFEDRDPLPIYTLAAAVQELLRGLLKPLGGGSFLKDSDLIVPEHKTERAR